MSISAIFISDRFAKPLICRRYQPNIPASVIHQFTTFLQSEEKTDTPIFFDEDTNVHYIYVQNNEIYFVLISEENCNAALCFEFLYRLTSIFQEYLQVIDESHILDNCTLIYEILDEIMDAGIIQTTDIKILKELAKPINKLSSLIPLRAPPISKPPSCITNSVSWRSEGIQYKNNICYLDVIESNHVLINSNGNVVHNFVSGKIKLNTRLSGMPELMFIFNDKVKMRDTTQNEAPSINNVYLEDIKFHQCVSLPIFESENIIKFIPPDGQCELMTYRISLTDSKPPIEVSSNYSQSSSTLRISVKFRSNYRLMSTAKFIEIELPVPTNVCNSQIRTSNGRGRYDPNKNCFIWSLRSASYNRTYFFDVYTKLPTIDRDHSLNSLPPIIVRYDVRNFVLSGINVRSLLVTDKSGYRAQSWIRYSTQNGEYHIRIN